MAAATFLAGITILDNESVYLGEIGADHRLLQGEHRAEAAGVPGVVCERAPIFFIKTPAPRRVGLSRPMSHFVKLCRLNLLVSSTIVVI
jgi:hypothetical protein